MLGKLGCCDFLPSTNLHMEKFSHYIFDPTKFPFRTSPILRYMAPEVLQPIPRQSSADIFSLGATIYEVCLPLPAPPPRGVWGSNHQYSNLLISQGSMLPSEGPMWHNLRTGKADPLSGRPPALWKVISVCMAPEPLERPTSQQLLALPLIRAASSEPDPVLLAAKTRPMPPPIQFQRSASMTGPEALGLVIEHSSSEDLGAIMTMGEASQPPCVQNRVSTPTNFMTGGGGFWLWPAAPTPQALSQTNGNMETSPM